MKLWLISQDKNKDCDTFDRAVVAAETYDDARRMHPSGGNINENSRRSCAWVSNPNDVKCQYIGEAAEGTVKSIICASFHAG
jgi:hypothetical protein